MESLDKVGKFTECLETLLLKMQEADNTCMEQTSEISKRDFAIITFVGKQGEVIMKELADYAGIPVSTATGVVDKLVEKDCLKRYHSDQDRRIIKIGLGGCGQDLFDLLMRVLNHMGNSMLAGLTDQEQDQLIHLLTKVQANLVNYVPLPPQDATIK